MRSAHPTCRRPSGGTAGGMGQLGCLFAVEPRPNLGSLARSPGHQLACMHFIAAQAGHTGRQACLFYSCTRDLVWLFFPRASLTCPPALLDCCFVQRMARKPSPCTQISAAPDAAHCYACVSPLLRLIVLLFTKSRAGNAAVFETRYASGGRASLVRGEQGWIPRGERRSG